MAVFATRTSFAGHASLGAKAAHELRFALDHPVGADHAEGTVVANVSPDPPRHRLAFGQDRHGRIVAVQTFGSQDMGRDQIVKRAKREGAGADLIGQRRQ